MSTSLTRLLFLLAMSLIATGAYSQQNPDHERGMRPGLAYRLEGLDQVNLFNGNVNLSLPLGATYPVGGTLSYSLGAHYATNAWESMTHEEDIEGAPFESRTYTYWYPSEHANAGFGWIVSLGRIDTTQHPEDGSDILSYVSPDGNKHGFKPTLHKSTPPEAVVSGVEYTQDGTYLRLKHQTPSGYRLEFPNGHFHKFNAQGLLTRMEDPFGNYVDVVYETQGPSDPHPGSTVWVITDSEGRMQRVYFRPGWDYFEELWPTNNQPFVKSHEMVDRVELGAFGGATAVYQFYYLVLPQTITPANANDPSLKTSRRCGTGVQDPEVPEFVRVSLLSGISMPENAWYTMVTDRGDLTNCSTTLFGGVSGNLTKLTLPTGGTVEWTYQVYGFPTVSKPSHNAGVKTRTARLINGGTVIGVTSYVGGSVSDEYGADRYRTVINKDGDNTIVNATKHYFAACPNSYSCGSSIDYGLPYRRDNHLSTETQVPDSNGLLVTKRKTFLRYEADSLILGSPWDLAGSNQRVAWQKTEYVDDGSKYEEVTYSDFDGLGHYRKAVTGGTFASGNIRTSFTDYNPGVGTYDLNADGTLRFPYNMIPSTSPWLLTTFDRQWVSEPNDTGNDTYSRTSVCFNADGFMTSRRTHKDLVQEASVEDLLFTNDVKDLLAVFTPDGGGNLQKEQYFGGELTNAPDQACNSSYSGEAYRIDHTYSSGVEESSYYVKANGTAMSFYLSDNVIDTTGLVSATRRYRGYGSSDGLSTTFTYDLLGRLKDATGTRLKTSYLYSVQPPKITIADKTLVGTTLRTSTMEFDALGRLTRETRSMPNGVTAERTTAYNGLGWKTSITDWGGSAPTLFGYDGFGRPTSIQAPDQSAATISYSGVSQVSRTTKVRTGGTGAALTLTPSVTTEDYDRQGRLIRVTEPPPAVGGSRPETEYHYDVGGRLTKVCANVNASDECGQTRSFTYDNRGFLRSETHPENGTTTYVSYDARGHLRRRYTGSPYQFDVELNYDRADRLAQVDERLSASDTRPLKMFFYADGNDGTDKKNGRLFEAVRYNWFSIPAATPIPFNVQVIETYAYTDPEGNVSSRETKDYACPVSAGQDCESLRPVSVNHSFRQEFTYDELDATKALAYPKCLLGGCTSMADRAVTNTYSQGLLTNVSSGNTASASITYHPSGLVNAVQRGNGVTDTQLIDPLMPGRPQEIVTTGATAVGACIAPSFTQQPGSTTIESGVSTPLSALATGQDGQMITYQWYRGTAADTTNPIGTGLSINVSPTTTTNYWVRATNTCGATRSTTATVTVCDPAHITAAQANLTMTRGESRTLQIGAAGSASLGYQWFTVATNGTETPIPGATSASLTISPSQTTKYRVKATNDCGDDSDDATVTVVDPPTVPAFVTATYNTSTGRNDISWGASSSSVGISHYLIKRHPGNVTFTINHPTVSYTDQTALVAGKAYVYRVAAVDNNGISSADAGPDLVTVRTFTTDPLPGLATIQAVYVSELRSAVDAVRFAVGLPLSWSSYVPPVGQEVDAADFTQLRDRLNEARAALQMSLVTFSAPVVSGQPVEGSTLIELRDGVK